MNNDSGALATDACSPASLTWTQVFTPLTQHCGQAGSAVVTFSVRDQCGLVSSTVA
jgi:large repetitive protein